jgi:hypothetical protein
MHIVKPVVAVVTNPITCNILSRIIPQQIVVEDAFDVYADSVNGNNANDGLSSSTPKQTLAAARALLTDGLSLGLARGSYWREQFDVPTNDLTIGVYGSGAAPIIDGANVVVGTWTQPNVGLYPDVWSLAWTRNEAATTGSAHVAVWVDGALPSRYATTLADLQTNGGYNANTLISTSTTVSIKSATNPNSDGKLYEISHRRYGINGHATTLAAGVKINQQIEGPIEIKRAIDHYNGHAGGDGTTKKLLILDGNIHHTVTQGSLTEDSIFAFATPSLAASMAVAYTAISPATFEHTFRRCMSIMPGGVNRLTDTSGFYAHGTATLAEVIIEECITQAATLASADALSVIARNCYSEETLQGQSQCGPTTNSFSMDRIICRDLTTIASTAGNTMFRRASGSSTITLNNCGFWSQKGLSVQLIGDSGTRPQVTNCVIAGTTNSGAIGGGGFVGCTYSVLQANGACFTNSTIVSDYNICYFHGQAFVRSIINGTLRNSLSAWQAATGQDTNSVYVRHVDQNSGNPLALWLGVATGANSGPASGDWRINPGARVYTGADVARIGTFADGTPITAAGIQEHWNFNTRTVVAGPPTRSPVFPVTVAEMRTYLDDPTSWNFYP